MAMDFVDYWQAVKYMVACYNNNMKAILIAIALFIGLMIINTFLSS